MPEAAGALFVGFVFEFEGRWFWGAAQPVAGGIVVVAVDSALNCQCLLTCTHY